MKEIIANLQDRYKNGNWVEKLIFINLAVFILSVVFGGFRAILPGMVNFWNHWFALNADFNIFITKPWTVITYGFLHFNFFHILFNLITLFYFGNLFLDFFVPKKLIKFYVLGTICGGIFFLLTYNLFPNLKHSNTSVVGASAAIMAIIIGLATHVPNYQLKFRFIGYIKLSYLAYAFIVWDLINLSGNNTGGHLAHLGGGLYGFLSVYYQNSFKFKNNLKTWFKPKSPLKTTYKAKQPKAKQNENNQTEVDRILDKISQSGYEALSKEEKEFLFKQKK